MSERRDFADINKERLRLTQITRDVLNIYGGIFDKNGPEQSEQFDAGRFALSLSKSNKETRAEKVDEAIEQMGAGELPAEKLNEFKDKLIAALGKNPNLK